MINNDDKVFCIFRIDFLCQNEMLLLSMKKLLKIAAFVQNSGFFCLNCQISYVFKTNSNKRRVATLPGKTLNLTI